MTTDPDPASMMLVGWIAAALFAVLTAALSLGEEAFSAIGDARIHELVENGNRRAARIRRLTEKDRRFADHVRLGTWLNVMAAAVSVCFACPVTVFAERMQKLFRVPFSYDRYMTWCLIAELVTVIGTAFVLGFLTDRLPRRLVQKAPEKTALAVLPLFEVAYVLTQPLDRLCALITYPLLRLCGIDPRAEQETVTEEDILEMMDAGEETGAIEGTQKDMVNNIFAFDDITAAAIMTPRTDVCAIEVDEPLSAALREGVENGYSRIPVYEEDIDHIIGILYVKDLLMFVGREIPADVTVRSLVRETHFVPDTKKCDDLFEEMNEKHLQMAIVVDEYGGVAGIVTMEDLLESIVGNMQDEFDDEEEEVTRLEDGSYVLDGSLSIGELEELLEIELPEGDYDTLAGFLMDQLGHIPEEDEAATVVYGRVTFTIRRMDDRRIEQVLARPAVPESPAENGDAK